MQTEQFPVFPAIRFEAHSIQRFDSIRALNLGTQVTLEADPVSEEMFLIDRELLQFPVIEIKPLRRSVNPAYWGSPRPVYVLHTRFGAPKRVSLDFARCLVIDRVLAGGWYRQGGESANRFKKNFESFQSWAEVLTNISLYGNRMF